jgi:hypothetical protein
MSDYGPEFFSKIPEAEWSKALANLNGKLGDYQGSSLAGWNVSKNVGTPGAGTTITLQYQVTYAKHQARETFTVFKGASQTEYKIVGHVINSDGLLKE